MVGFRVWMLPVVVLVVIAACAYLKLVMNVNTQESSRIIFSPVFFFCFIIIFPYILFSI